MRGRFIPREPGITILTDDTLVVDYGRVKETADFFPGRSSESNVLFTDSTLQAILNVLVSLWSAILLRSLPIFLNVALPSHSPVCLLPLSRIKWIILSWPPPRAALLEQSCFSSGDQRGLSTPNGLTPSEPVSKTVETRNSFFKRRVLALCQRIHNLAK